MFDIEPLTDQPLGAIVKGWDPGSPMSSNDVDIILDAMARHLVLIFRGHRRPDDAELVEFGRAFGPLITGAGYFGEADRFPEILRVTNRVDEKGVPIGVGMSNGCDWHADYSYLPTVGDISFLECTAHPSRGGATYFCDMYAAVNELPAKEVEFFTGKNSYHDALAAERAVTAEDAEKKRCDGQALREKPSAVHPVIIRHPRTDRRTLYVSPMLTRYICGVTAEESHTALEEVYRHHIRPEHIYKHEWRPGDMVVWDTIGTVHRRDSFPESEVRDMRQMSTLWVH